MFADFLVFTLNILMMFTLNTYILADFLMKY